MYDRGSNTNLVLGKVAQQGKMEPISSEPKVMTVAGGHQLTTKYGSYRVEIGPYITGGDKFTDCQGVNSIVGNLKKQNLQEVNEELRASNFFEPTIPLPKYAGGGNVGILVGIQDVQLDPVLVCVLPSGTRLYRCPFVDIWGSQFTYGGPHPSFSASTSVGHTSSMFTRLSTRALIKNKDSRKSCRNLYMCHFAPPRWGDSALGLTRHRSIKQQPGYSRNFSKL